ncbi:hypothetical protein ACQRC6_01090 [Peptoniphilus sp. SGI.035]|uniref:hypothetical protein n=1 Tax=Peptoniphilus sp. SGI.035 TaxID=3420564 RepID=UPI003D059E0B
MVIDYDSYGKNLSLLFEDRVTAISVETYEDEKTKVTKRRKVTVVDNKPCRISFNVSSHSDDFIGHSEAERRDILTTGHDVNIPKGSDVIVTRCDGSRYHYKFSDTPSIHLSHRRYVLEKVDIS